MANPNIPLVAQQGLQKQQDRTNAGAEEKPRPLAVEARGRGGSQLGSAPDEAMRQAQANFNSQALLRGRDGVTRSPIPGGESPVGANPLELSGRNELDAAAMEVMEERLENSLVAPIVNATINRPPVPPQQDSPPSAGAGKPGQNQVPQNTPTETGAEDNVRQGETPDETQGRRSLRDRWNEADSHKRNIAHLSLLRSIDNMFKERVTQGQVVSPWQTTGVEVRAGGKPLFQARMADLQAKIDRENARRDEEQRLEQDVERIMAETAAQAEARLANVSKEARTEINRIRLMDAETWDITIRQLREKTSAEADASARAQDQKNIFLLERIRESDNVQEINALLEQLGGGQGFLDQLGTRVMRGIGWR